MCKMSIRWNDVNYGQAQAKNDYERLEINDRNVEPIDFGNDPQAAEWEALRNQLIDARDEVFEERGYDNAEKLDYDFDVAYGFKLYEILNENVGFNNREASNNDFWNWLSVRVIPDVVHSRWGNSPEHYFQRPTRTWLKVIWWYIHICWDGSEEATYELIKNNTTDTIQGLIERPGIGYYVDVYHEIMKRYKDYQDRNLFRRVMKLNTARLMTTSPELVDGGIEAYVEDLFKKASGENK